MASNTDLTTEQGFSAYLTSQSVAHTSVELLTGGSANWVYRVSFADGKTIVYKHAASYVRSNANFALESLRMDYESKVLQILPPLLKKQLPDSNVHPAGWYSYDQERKLLCLGDGGESELKKAYADPRLNIPKIGEELGRWIAAVHACSTQTSLSLENDDDLTANNPIGVNIYRYSYNGLAGALAEYGHDADFGKRINEEFGSKLATDNECICHGDFWPGNILVKIKDGVDKKVNMTVVDWEITRRGTSATDVGQFAAEAFLLDRFRGNRGLLPAFLNAYSSSRQELPAKDLATIDRNWVVRMAVHWGVHLAFWPTHVEWSDREGTRDLVDIGIHVSKAAIDGDWQTLYASELFRGVNEFWAECWRRL